MDFNKKKLLDNYATLYNCIEFIPNDPISIAHKYTEANDIAIAGFFAATLAWGNRKAILKSANELMQWMDNEPYRFVTEASASDLKPFVHFKYRTFNGTDCLYFIQSLKNIYLQHGGLQQVFESGYQIDQTIKTSISHFRKVFFELDYPNRTLKHIANTDKKSAAKRLNLFLRWMVRNNQSGVDFGLWKGIPQHALMIPLDVHTGTIARQLNLLKRTQNDWQAVEELTANLRTFDASDPIKYDFALFGLGVHNPLSESSYE